MKIRKIKVENFKAIDSKEIELNGSSVIVTGANDLGKSSLLNGLINRLRGEKPELIIREGGESGFYEMELTDGAVIKWGFQKRKLKEDEPFNTVREEREKFSFTTPDGLEIKTGVIKAISSKYFGIKFDIDKFINASSNEKLKQIQVLLGIDLTALDKEYKTAYDDRTIINRELTKLKSVEITEPEKVENPDIEKLENEKKILIQKNSDIRSEWSVNNKNFQNGINDYNKLQTENKSTNDAIKRHFELLVKTGETAFYGEFFDAKFIKKIEEKIALLPEIGEQKPLETLPEPKEHSTAEIDLKIRDAYTQKTLFNQYESNKNKYGAHIIAVTSKDAELIKITRKLEDIKQKKKDLIISSKLPSGFEINEEGVLYNGRKLDKNSVSSSSLYIAALKLGSLVVGDIRTMHFDASYLDKNSLQKIQEWANENELQLLIERPDFEANKIQYKFI